MITRSKSQEIQMLKFYFNASPNPTKVALFLEEAGLPYQPVLAFQNPTLLPWLNIRDNVMMPLKIVPPFKQEFSRKRRTEYRDRVEQSLSRVGLAGFGDKFPWQLSGGMQQRASLCRALIHDPTLLLLDEPFGALDQFTREELWEIMQQLWIDKRPTVLLVTHDLKEAAYLASRIAVMQARPGRIVDDSVVPFARPRTIEISFQPDFVSLTQRLRERIMAARAAQSPVLIESEPGSGLLF